MLYADVNEQEVNWQLNLVSFYKKDLNRNSYICVFHLILLGIQFSLTLSVKNIRVRTGLLKDLMKVNCC